MTDPTLSPDQIEALRDMVSVWTTDGFALIGAHALGCHIGLEWRETADLDVTVEVSVDDYPAGLDRAPGWTRDERIPHRWYSPRGVSVDVLPTHPDVLEGTGLQWPGDDRVLNLRGMRLVNQRSRPRELAPDARVRVPPLPVLVVLKMAAYLDRPAERQRDLQDLAQVLRGYPAEDDERRFEEDVQDRGLSFTESGPYVLGKEIREMGLHDDERELVESFLRQVLSDNSALATMRRELPSLDETSGRGVAVLLQALELGYSGRILQRDPDSASGTR